MVQFGSCLLRITIVLLLVTIILSLIGGMGFVGAKSLFWVGLQLNMTNTDLNPPPTYVPVWYGLFDKCHLVAGTKIKCFPLIPPKVKNSTELSAEEAEAEKEKLTGGSIGVVAITGVPATIITFMPYLFAASAAVTLGALFATCCLRAGAFSFVAILVLLIQAAATGVAMYFFATLKAKLKGNYVFGPGVYAAFGAVAIALLITIWSLCIFTCQRRQVCIDSDLDYDQKVELQPRRSCWDNPCCC